MLVRLLICVFNIVASYKIQFIDKVTARTTLKLWHNIHILRREPHDFSHLLGPQKKDVLYVAAISLDEVKAIGSCRRKELTKLQINQIAHAPDESEAACYLMREMSQGEDFVDFDQMRKQSRWFYEALYLCDSSEDTSVT